MAVGPLTAVFPSEACHLTGGSAFCPSVTRLLPEGRWDTDSDRVAVAVVKMSTLARLLDVRALGFLSSQRVFFSEGIVTVLHCYMLSDLQCTNSGNAAPLGCRSLGHVLRIELSLPRSLRSGFPNGCQGLGRPLR